LQAASSPNTNTLLGTFKIRPATGAQANHQTVLLQWIENNFLVLG